MRDTTVRAEIYPRTVTRKSRAESPDNASGALLPIGDAYGGEWPREQFRKHGIQYQISELNRSGLYLEERGGVRMGFVQFYRQRTAPNDLVGRVLAAQLANVQGI